MSTRHVAGILTVAGRSVRVESMDVQQTATKGADTLHASLSLYDNRWLASLAGEDVSLVGAVEAGSGSGELFIGTADVIDPDFTRGTIKISGRDKTKGPIGKKSIEDFRNKTPAEIVREIAGRHGLAAVIEGTASDFAGKQQQKEDFVHLTHHISDWTLVQHLADREGLVAFVQKNNLFFVEIDSALFGGVDVVFVPPTPDGHATGNEIELSCSRNLEAGRPCKCTVRSWNVKKKQAFEGRAQVGGNGAIRELEYSHPQLSQQQAQKIADKRLREVKRQEMCCRATMPGKASVHPPMKLNLSGTRTTFDQTYFIDNAHHQIGRGYRMSLTAKNSLGGN